MESGVKGIQVSEHMPRFAKQVQHCAILRSVYHESNLHGFGTHYNLTGLPPAPGFKGEPKVSREDPPCVGSVLRQVQGDRGELPGAVHLPARIGDQNSFQWAGQHAGYLGPKYDPLMLIDENWKPGTTLPSFRPQKENSGDRLGERVSLLESLEKVQRENRDDSAQQFERFRRQALEILGESSAAWSAFSIDEEKPATLARYGDNKFGRSCLVARRLVERGVRYVTVPWAEVVSTKNFDTHAKHFPLMKDFLLPPFDRAFSALIEDLAERGMLDETLVATTGEFGRTPKINKNGGRDHWCNVYSTVLAGGGIEGGQVWGSSDFQGGEPKDNPVHVRDFIATVYHALGLSSETVVRDTRGQPHHVVQGKPVMGLF
ncbi:MAG: DUF1501 domain-containing protein [Planctomycetota bacterium]